MDTESFEITPQPSVQAQEKHEDKQVKEAEAGQVNEDSMETDDAPAVCITLILAPLFALTRGASLAGARSASRSQCQCREGQGEGQARGSRYGLATPCPAC